MNFTPTYRPPAWLRLGGGHLQTILPALYRKVEGIDYHRERLWLPDEDFLDLDWLRHPAATSPRLAILSHGLEGDSHRPYLMGMAKHLYNCGYDVLAWNFRSCSGEMNLQKRFYHSGATEDLRFLVNWVNEKQQYQQIDLVGFSLGGNLTLKYLGEETPPPIIGKSVVFSVPTDLGGASERISTGFSKVYSDRFMRTLTQKIRLKAAKVPEIDLAPLALLKTLKDFDDVYTAPLHGFGTAANYYASCSANRFIADIQTPTLIVNAQNDPFLSAACYPKHLTQKHEFVTLETPEQGGHCGFTQTGLHDVYWSELRCESFLLGKN
ncbi:hypothetical protein SAMN05421780_108144 [Flexibacter flexilis DSM 6793]|uniref:AB hydrolase-1 domain-containing protein n=1 Tax=Flexibacter flexilis DSM 6793 TaxID=927664 RepID=A0A1I1LAV6_9BACT|nr:alpha/beta fold hydrolase [Flexibacter flexilis]SFC70149.1 hypothetical protein SAMN05421780_108144 [Flexibacter flexilis DSM 6793]